VGEKKMSDEEYTIEDDDEGGLSGVMMIGTLLPHTEDSAIDFLAKAGATLEAVRVTKFLEVSKAEKKILAKAQVIIDRLFREMVSGKYDKHG
jgi:hypothetical protein